MSTLSGLCEVTPGRVLGSERITNSKLNDLGNPTVRVGEGAIGARELDPGVLSGTTPAPGSVTEATIVDKAVTNAKLADVATNTLKGRRTAGTGSPEDLTGIQAVDDVLSPAEATVASATTTDIGAATSPLVQITGTTTITGLGTAAAGRRRVVRFAGILTLTHNGTSLILPGAVNITTAAGDTAEFVSLGSGNWRCLRYTRTNGAPVRLLDEDDMVSNSDQQAPTQQSVKAYVDARSTTSYILVRDEKSSGSNGGTFNSGSWQTRTLNTEVQDTGGHASLAANVITLAAGTYDVWIRCPAFDAGTHQGRLYSVTDAAVALLGNVSTAVVGATSESFIQGRIVLGVSTELRVEHRCSSSKATEGYGRAGGWGTEVYASAEFRKVG